HFGVDRTSPCQTNEEGILTRALARVTCCVGPRCKRSTNRLNAGDGLKIFCEHLHSARRLLPVEVFVGCMIAVLWKAEAEKYNWRLQVFLHRHHGADGSPFTYESGIP